MKPICWLNGALLCLGDDGREYRKRRHNWLDAILYRNLPREMAGYLTDWRVQSEDVEPYHRDSLSYQVKAETDRIDVTILNHGSIWIEHEAGEIRVHCYPGEREEPITINLNPDGTHTIE